MARNVRFKGSLEVSDAAGKNPELKQAFDITVQATEMVKLLKLVPRNTGDYAIDLAGIPQVKLVYLNPDNPCSVKFLVTDSFVPITGPCVMFAQAQELHVSTGPATDVTLEVVVLGT